MAEQRETDKDWKVVAEKDPYWGVLSLDEYRVDGMDKEKISSFMQTGEDFVGNLFALIRKHISPDFMPVRALDFGCGVGRLLLPIARHVTEAVGVDVAPAMLNLCRQHAEKSGIKNISLFEADDGLTSIEGGFDLVNTYIVLQHIPPSRGYKLIARMLELLSVGGIGSIQLTYAKSRKYLIHEAATALYYRRDGGVITDIVETHAAPPEGTISMFDYDLNQVLAQVSRICGHPLIALPTNDDSHLGVHFVFQKSRDC